MRALFLFALFIFSISSCSAESGTFQFYGKIRASKDHRFYLQVFPGQTRMYRIFIKGEKMKLAPFLNRSVGFKGEWSGDRKDAITLKSPLQIVAVKHLATAPHKL